MSVTAASESILDEAALDELRDLDDQDGGFFLEVVQAYLTDVPAMVDELRLGIQNGNAERTTRVAHSMKSSSFQLGAKQLGELCRQAEELSRRGSCEGLEPLLAAIESQVVAVRAALATEIEG